ncbi:MAG: AAA family ATPase [Thermoplasmata archaeon]
MQTIAHAEVLARDWLPPVVPGRASEVAELVRRLDPPAPHAPPPWIVAVAGVPGSGTSTVARRAAREVADRVRAALGEPFPRVLAVRTPFLRGPHGVATALLQRLDDGFDGRGFPVPEILAGLMRRLRREGRPTVVLLDDVGVGGPDLAPVVRAFAEPDRFLPEGETGLPPLWTLLAGTHEGLQAVERAVDSRTNIGPFVPLAPYAPGTLRTLVADRAERALGHPASSDLVSRIVGRTVEDGGGARRAIELLRREILGVTIREVRDGVPSTQLRALSVEPWVVRAIGVAAQGRAARLGEVKRLEAELAREHGARPLPTTTLWRRIVRLEQAGYVRREIRPGGSGGTLSVVRILTPVDEWVTMARRPGTRPVVEHWSGPDVPVAAASSGFLRAELGHLPDDP